MNGIIFKTSGIHNLEIFLALGLLICACALVTWRLYSAFITFAALHQTKCAISYIPKSSVQSVELTNLEKKHKDEWIQLLQTNPRSYMIPRAQITGHTENMKLTNIREYSTEIELEVIGSGTCTLFVGVPKARLDSLIVPAQSTSAGTLPLLSHDCMAQLRQQSLFTSESVRFDQCTKLSISIDSRAFRNACEDPLRISLVAVVGTQSHNEVTTVSCRAEGQFLVSGIHQFLLSHISAECIEIFPVFVQNMEECMICYDSRSNTVILDCRHCCMCSTCIGRLNEPRCIVCRANFSQYLQDRS